MFDDKGIISITLTLTPTQKYNTTFSLIEICIIENEVIM